MNVPRFIAKFFIIVGVHRCRYAYVVNSDIREIELICLKVHKLLNHLLLELCKIKQCSLQNDCRYTTEKGLV